MSKFENAKAYVVTAAITASTMVPAFADDFDTSTIVTKIAAAGVAVGAICVAIAGVWVIRKGWNMIFGRSAG